MDPVESPQGIGSQEQVVHLVPIAVNLADHFIHQIGNQVEKRGVAVLNRYLPRSGLSQRPPVDSRQVKRVASLKFTNQPVFATLLRNGRFRQAATDPTPNPMKMRIA